MGSSTQTARTEAQKTVAEPGAAMALLYAEGRVVGWSQSAQRLVGYSAAEVVGQSAGILLTTADARAKASVVGEQSGLRGRWSDVAQVRHRDGRRIDVRLCAQSLAGRDGRAQWLVSATDEALIPSSSAKGTTTSERPSAAPPPPRRPPIGVEIRDTRLRCIWVNDIQGTEAESLEAVTHQLLDSGDLLINADHQGFLGASAHHEPTSTASFLRLDDAQGRALGVCTADAGVTGNGRAHECRAILDEAGKRIGTSLNIMRTGQELADIAVPFLTDYTTVDLADPVLLGEEPWTLLGPDRRRDPVFRRAGLASIHPGAPESLFARGEPVPAPPMSCYTAAMSGGSRLYPVVDTTSAAWLDRDPMRAKRMRETGMHSLMIVPIHARGALLGVAAFTRTQDPRPFDADDLLLAEELVGRAALSLDNARQYARERSAALALQRHLLPHDATGGPAAE
ncbi:GAF domain-containing protein, partial [Streptomyces chiangmaiensis]